MKNYCWTIFLILLAFPAFAETSMDRISEALLKEFFASKKPSKDVFELESKGVGDIGIESLTFSLGSQEYRLVVFDDGKLKLSTRAMGDLAFQEMISSHVREISPKKIIRMVRSFHSELPDAKAYEGVKDGVDTEEERIKQDSKALQWSQIIDRAASGQALQVSDSSGQSLGASVSAAKMMNQCAGRNKFGGPQRAASENLAQALVLANLADMKKTQDEAVVDRSRDFEKKGSYSFFDEVDEFQNSSPQSAFRLLQQTRINEYEIFKSSLQKSVVGKKDPYYLAANRNFMFLVRTIGKKKTLALMDRGMKKIVLNIKRFVEYRKMLPASSIVYNRRIDRYFVDPTLNQPTQARYLLSLVCLFEWKNSDKKFQENLKKFESKPSTSQVTDQLHQSYRDFLKNVSHPRFQ